jgi:hypothetical protein
VTHDEMVVVLARCASLDPYMRAVDEADVQAWLGVLGDHDYREAYAAVIAHFRDNSRRIWPADINRWVWEQRDAWQATHPGLVPPETLPGLPEAPPLPKKQRSLGNGR